MEFKYRSLNAEASSADAPPSQSSGLSYFAEQALRAGYPGPDFNRRFDHLRKPSYTPEALWRELEKEQIREEVIAEEMMARRRVLEHEVWRELVMEREVGLRRGFGFHSHSSIAGYGSRLPFMRGENELKLLDKKRPLEDRIATSLEARRFMGFSDGCVMSREMGTPDDVPFLQRSAQPKISEIKPPSALNASKEKEIIVLSQAKPNTCISGSKRKAFCVKPETIHVSDLPSVAQPNKKSKAEWSCDVCQITATSEFALYEHLKGKRHQSKENAQRSRTSTKNFTIGLFPKKTEESLKLVGSDDNPNSEKEENLMAEPKHCGEIGEASLQILSTEDVLKVNDNLDNSKKMNIKPAQKRKQKNKESFKFWCELCQVGTVSRKVMNRHFRGKKHVFRLLKLQKSNGNSGDASVEGSNADKMDKEHETSVVDSADKSDRDGKTEGSEVIASDKADKHVEN